MWVSVYIEKKFKSFETETETETSVYDLKTANRGIEKMLLFRHSN